jgi:hypothetical protein
LVKTTLKSALQAESAKAGGEKRTERINEALLRRSSPKHTIEQARGHLNTALKTDLSDAALRAMLDWIEGTERQHAVQSAIGEAEELASKQQFRAALDRLDQAIARWGAEGLASLRARIDHERQQSERRIRVANAARSARESLDRDWPEAAVDQLRAALADDPGEPELEALLATAEAGLESKRKAQRIEQAGARVESLLQSRHFDRAVEEVEAALRQYRGAPELARLLNRVEESRLASCRADVQSLLDREQFGAALEGGSGASPLFRYRAPKHASVGRSGEEEAGA